MVQVDFDPESVPPSVPFELLPDGWYPMQFVKSEVGDSKSGHKMLKLEAQVLEEVDPDHANRKLFINLNMWHPDEKTMTIARRDYAAVCQACGVRGADTDELLMIPLAVKIKTRPAKGDYGPSNDPAGYDKFEVRFQQNTAAKPVAAKPAPTVAKAAPSAAPWKKK